MRSKVNKPASNAFRVELGSGFILLFALIWFFDESGFIAALIPAVLVHELGHICFLLFFGGRPTKMKATLSGLRIDYSGYLTEVQEMLAALAGPAFGLVFSFLCAGFGRLWGSEYLLMCAGIGFVVNLFNFLPVLPLDGGRVLGFTLRIILGYDRARPVLHAVGAVTSALILALGLYCIARGLGPALFFAGVWLLVLRYKH